MFLVKLKLFDPAFCKITSTEAILVPSTLETISELILNTLPLEVELATRSVVIVVTARPTLLPVTVDSPAMFGAVMACCV